MNINMLFALYLGGLKNPNDDFIINYRIGYMKTISIGYMQTLANTHLWFYQHKSSHWIWALV